MADRECLYCYEPISDSQDDFHSACSKKFFGTSETLELPFGEEDMIALAQQVIRTSSTVPGVQEKISLDLDLKSKSDGPRRFTIVGLWGHFILKPPSPRYPQMPEVEDLTMHLADLARIRTAPHSLIRMRTGSLAYITRRFDRVDKRKLHAEDFCQLTERQTEHKYRGSYEQVAKAITRFSASPGLDNVDFYSRLVFSFLTGNADMHLKNFSLLESAEGGYTLSPAYDLLATALVNPKDKEEIALTLCARKSKLSRKHFDTAMSAAGLTPKQRENIFAGYSEIIPTWLAFLDRSFLNAEFKTAYKNLIQERAERIK